MAFAYNLLATAIVLISAVVQSLATLSRREIRTAPGPRDEYPLIPPLGSQHYAGQGPNDLEPLNIVLLASVDGNLHALNRSTGTILWSMSSNSPNSPSALGPLVRTQQAIILDDESDDPQQEYYVIEPQSGDIYVMSSKSEPLQRLPFSMSTLVDMSPFSFSGEEDSKVFVGRKETSLLLIELETGRIKQTISSECPWNEYEDPFEDLKEAEEELDFDEQDDAKLPKPRKPTEVFVGRTGESAIPRCTQILTPRRLPHLHLHQEAPGFFLPPTCAKSVVLRLRPEQPRQRLSDTLSKDPRRHVYSALL